MNKELFNDWASTYNQSIQKDETDKTYPFYGYGKVQKHIHNQVNKKNNSKILEMGIGTGMMTVKLYESNHSITGVDFSRNMINEAKKTMPLNRYIESDFSRSLEHIKDETFDSIIFTYSIHHLKLPEQIDLIKKLVGNLNANGMILIGDVMTKTNKEMIHLAKINSKIWDNEESYPVFSEYDNEDLRKYFHIDYTKTSFCSGVITLKKSR